ncbi:hypothetical protein MMC22_008728 [Lobaria immixta]|nr:hypothetical protein [Lobaria immixta]
MSMFTAELVVPSPSSQERQQQGDAPSSPSSSSGSSTGKVHPEQSQTQQPASQSTSKNIIRVETSNPSSIPEKLALQAWQRFTHRQGSPDPRPGRLSEQESQPIAARIATKPRPARQDDHLVKLHGVPKPVALRPATAAKSSKSIPSSASPRVDGMLQNYCKADVLEGGTLSAGQIYENAVAKLRNTRRQLALKLQERSEADIKARKAETSVRALRSIAKKGNVAAKIFYMRNSKFKDFLQAQKACKAKLAGMGRKIQRLRLEEKRQECAVEQAEGAAQDSGVKLETWRKITGLERWKEMTREDE